MPRPSGQPYVGSLAPLAPPCNLYEQSIASCVGDDCDSIDSFPKTCLASASERRVQGSGNWTLGVGLASMAVSSNCDSPPPVERSRTTPVVAAKTRITPSSRPLYNRLSADHFAIGFICRWPAILAFSSQPPDWRWLNSRRLTSGSCVCGHGIRFYFLSSRRSNIDVCGGFFVRPPRQLA